MLESVLIANRGEIARRIIRVAKRMGIATVAVYSDADRTSAFVEEADEAFHIGPSEPLKSYLDGRRIIEVAERAGVQAIHPGYGFLSENAQFARLCIEAGLTFVGPAPETIEALGDKIQARLIASEANVPVIPGHDASGGTDAEVARAIVELGLPVIVKPSAGGGGKGIRRIDSGSNAGLLEEIADSRREALTAFGDDTLLIEKVIEKARHIEGQILADRHGRIVFAGERDCSIQRRHQKIVEESPAPGVDDKVRLALAEYSVAMAAACGYVGVGTVEFLVKDDIDVFFLEMNTRLQVEYAVTEATRGIDMIEQQFRIASGEHLDFAPEVLPAHGHAIEARIYAEDPASGFLPSIGEVRRYREAEVANVRTDSGIRQGDTVGTFYDPLLAKVIAWGVDRPSAINALSMALRETVILGLETNSAFVRQLLASDVMTGERADTEFVESAFGSFERPEPPAHVLCAAVLAVHGAAIVRGGAADPWTLGDGWILGGNRPSRYEIRSAPLIDVVAVVRGYPAARVEIEKVGSTECLVVEDGDELAVEVDGVLRHYLVAADSKSCHIFFEGEKWSFEVGREARAGSGAHGGAGPIVAPMPGRVVAVNVAVSDEVEVGDVVTVVEAMKMEHPLVSRVDGKVAEVNVRVGDQVSLKQVLVVIEAVMPDA